VPFFPDALTPSPDDAALPTERRLLLTGERLFVARSYQSVSVNEICAAAQVLKGSFYHWFPAKQDLGIAVIDDIEGGMVALLEEHERAARGPINKLRANAAVADVVLDRLLRTFGRPIGMPIVDMAGELAVAEPAVSAHAAAAIGRWQQRVAGHCHDIDELGLLCPGTDPDELARMIMATMQGMTLLTKIDDAARGMVGAAVNRVIDNAVESPRR
jgi:TetR/AcrR family transcriptional repressor of nem operon